MGKQNPLKPGFKMCYGPLHREGVWVPHDRDHFHLTYGKFRAECKDCANSRKAHENSQKGYVVHGYVEFSRYKFVFIELIRRLGKAETARRLNYSYSAMWELLKGSHINIQRDTARRAVLLLREVRATGEVRHKKSIRYGAKERGREEKTPKGANDFYFGPGDSANEYRRQLRSGE